MRDVCDVKRRNKVFRHGGRPASLVRVDRVTATSCYDLVAWPCQSHGVRKRHDHNGRRATDQCCALERSSMMSSGTSQKLPSECCKTST